MKAKNFLLLVFTALCLTATGCSSYQTLVWSDKRPFKNSREEALAFTEPQYSVVAFRPHPSDKTFLQKEDRRQRAEVNQVIDFLGGAITADCPVFTIEDKAGYMVGAVASVNEKPVITKVYQDPIRYTNKTGTVYFDRRPESRKEPYGVIISDGIKAPKVYWGTKNYLKKVKRRFGIKTYSDFKNRLGKRRAPEAASATVAVTPAGGTEKNRDKPAVIHTEDDTVPPDIKALSDDDLTQAVSEVFASNFLKQETNARIPMQEGQDDYSWEEKITYFNDENRAESVSLHQGKEPLKAKIQYDKNEKPLRLEYEDGLLMIYEYEYWGGNED